MLVIIREAFERRSIIFQHSVGSLFPNKRVVITFVTCTHIGSFQDYMKYGYLNIFAYYEHSLFPCYYPFSLQSRNFRSSRTSIRSSLFSQLVVKFTSLCFSFAESAQVSKNFDRRKLFRIFQEAIVRLSTEGLNNGCKNAPVEAVTNAGLPQILLLTNNLHVLCTYVLLPWATYKN